MDHLNRFIDIRVINLRDEKFISLLKEPLLYESDPREVFNIFVVSRIQGHIFRTHCKSLFVLTLLSYTECKW